MKKFLICCLLLPASLFAQVLSSVRVSYSSVIGRNPQENNKKVAVGGDIYTYNNSNSTYDFDMRNNVTAYPTNCKGYIDIALAKYKKNGDLYWVKTIGGAKYEEAGDIIYHNNAFYLTGGFSGQANLNFVNPIQNYTADSSEYTYFVGKYDTTGAMQWIKILKNADGTPINHSLSKMPTVEVMNDTSLLVNYMSTSNNDNFTNYLLDTVQFKTNMMLRLDTRTGGISEIYVKNPLGINLYNKTHASTLINRRDKYGNLYVFKEYVSDSVDIDLDIATNNWLKMENRNAQLLIKYNANKQLLWKGQISPMSPLSSITGTLLNSIVIDDMLLDDAGNMYTTGSFIGKVDFKLGADTTYYTNNGKKLNKFIAKYNSNGVLQWVTQNIVWDYYINNPFFFSVGSNTVVIAPNQEFIDYGYGFVDDTTLTTFGQTRRVSYIFRYDSLGNKIRSNVILDIFTKSLIYTADGDLLVTGQVMDYNCDLDLDTAGVYMVSPYPNCFDCSQVWVIYKDWALSTHAPLVGGTSIYPTPATHELVVQRSAGSPPAAATLYDLWGRIVLATTLTQPRSQIGVGELPNGFYVLRIAGEGRSYKVVVQR